MYYFLLGVLKLFCLVYFFVLSINGEGDLYLEAI